MGGSQSSDPDAKKRNDDIDRQIRRDRIDSQNTVKLLLLGAGESGKSTVVKQMKIIHKIDSGFDEKQLKTYRDIVYTNTLQSITAIIQAMDWIKIPFSSESGKGDAQMLLILAKNYNGGEISTELGGCIKRLAVDSGVQEGMSQSSKYQLIDSAPYFLNNLDRILAPNFIPSEQDVLHTRVKTTGINECQFKMQHRQMCFKMVDVGGQRSERRKWIHCFDDVTAIIFCVALSAYDLVLAEDEEVNRMHEALQLFDSVINHKYFKGTSIILFLNKKDLLKKKVAESPLNLCFHEYQGANTYDDVANYIEQKFRDKDLRKRPIYAHRTCATDTDNVENVFNDVADVILRKQLEEIQLL